MNENNAGMQGERSEIRNEVSGDAERVTQIGHVHGDATFISWMANNRGKTFFLYALLLALVVASAFGVRWFFDPASAIRSGQAVESEKRKRLAKLPPLRYEATYDFVPWEGEYYVFQNRLSFTTSRQLQALNIVSADTLRSIVWANYGLQVSVPHKWDTVDSTEAITPLRLDLEGRRATPVLITSIEARVLKRGLPLSGSLVSWPPQGEDSVVQIGFDLDSSDLAWRKTGRGGILREHYDADRFIWLKKGEPIVLKVKAHTSKHYCEWDIRVKTRSEGRDEEVIINDRGKPFRTSALASKYASEFLIRNDRRGFEPVSPVRRRIP